MKFHRASFVKAVTAFVAIVSFSSCVSTNTMESSAIPTLPTESPIKYLPSKTFAFNEFLDTRGNDPFVVGQWGAHKLVLDKPAADIVADVIKKEFERNGHSCVPISQQAKADFMVEGAVYQYYLHQFTRLTSVKAIANVGVQLTIRSMSSNNSILVKKYQGEHPITGDYEITSEILEDALNQALLSVLRQIFYDVDLIEFIKKNSEA